jgi:hypothetical protein
MPQRRRVIAYIDGYNLYHGLRAAEWRRYLWLDLPALAGSLILDSQKLILTKYFTTRISSPESKRKRQSDYLEALAAHCGASIQMFWGHYQVEPWTCKLCKGIEQVPHEKKTDVNIAVEMLTDAYANAFDSAVLISADSDLVPPIEAVRRLFPAKRILVAFPPERFSVELKSVAHASFGIGRAKFAASQLPECVTKAGGTELVRPAKWTDIPNTNFGAILKCALDDKA